MTPAAAIAGTVAAGDVQGMSSCACTKNAATMERQFAVAPPTLAVAVLSPHDRPNRMVQRVAQLLQRGVGCVWLVDPETRDVTVHRSNQKPLLLEAHQELDGGETLPSFRCRVAEFFATPGE